MEITLRQANKEDVPAILEISNHAILHTTANYEYEPKSLEYQMDWDTQRIAAGFPIIVATNNDKVVGYGSFGTFRSRRGYDNTIEHSVYVHHEHRNQKIGHQLMRELINIAKAQNYHVMIAVVDIFNQGSLRFHKRFGFVEAGRLKEIGYKFGRWSDIYFLQLML